MTHFINISRGVFFLLCLLPPPSFLCPSSTPAVCLPHSLLCLHDMFVWQPHMVMIETLSLVQMGHLSHTCLPAVAVARAREAAVEGISCWLPHRGWLICLWGHRELWPRYHLPPLTLPANVTLDSPTVPPLPPTHPPTLPPSPPPPHICMITGTEM